MVRVAGLKRRIADRARGADQRRHRARRRARRHQRDAPTSCRSGTPRVFDDDVKPTLDDAGIHIEALGDLDADDRAQIDEIFSNQIFPVLMPLAVDPAHPFPYISGLSLNLVGARAQPEDRPHRVRPPQGAAAAAPLRAASG